MCWYKSLILGAVSLVVLVDVAATPAKADSYYYDHDFDRVQEIRRGQEWRRVQEIRRAQEIRHVQEIRRAQEWRQSHEVRYDVR